MPQLAALVLRKALGKKDGVALGTQPLSIIMEEKLRTSPVPTALLTMTGTLKRKDTEFEVAQLSSPMEYVTVGQYVIVLGHAESWYNKVGQELLTALQKKGMIILIFVDEMHQGLDQFWNSIR